MHLSDVAIETVKILEFKFLNTSVIFRNYSSIFFLCFHLIHNILVAQLKKLYIDLSCFCNALDQGKKIRKKSFVLQKK